VDVEEDAMALLDIHAPVKTNARRLLLLEWVTTAVNRSCKQCRSSECRGATYQILCEGRHRLWTHWWASDFGWFRGVWLHTRRCDDRAFTERLQRSTHFCDSGTCDDTSCYNSRKIQYPWPTHLRDMYSSLVQWTIDRCWISKRPHFSTCKDIDDPGLLLLAWYPFSINLRGLPRISHSSPHPTYHHPQSLPVYHAISLPTTPLTPTADPL
jgi:hypothetical protein